MDLTYRPANRTICFSFHFCPKGGKKQPRTGLIMMSEAFLRTAKEELVPKVTLAIDYLGLNAKSINC